MVHSSLSACGYIQGGPKTVVDVLSQWIEDGRLAMPTHTYCYPNEQGHTPVFDVKITPSQVGAITNYFWQQIGVVRSLHPSHSLACSGLSSQALCAGHELCETPCGKGTPYEQLVHQDAAVLMFGATMNTYTLFHTLEDAAQVPYLYEDDPYTLYVKDRDNEVRPLSMRRQDMQVPRRFTIMDEWLEERGLIKRQELGQGQLIFVPHALALHERMLKELQSNPWFLVAEEL